MKTKPYRKNAGIVIFNRKGQVLVGERTGFSGHFQFPQGGINSGESPLAAARRELKEETGLHLSGMPVFEIPEWLHYTFPENMPKQLQGFCGQKQKWFFFFWNGQLKDLKYKDYKNPEFTSLKWAVLRDVCQNIVSFKKPVYDVLHIEGRKVITTYLKISSISRWGSLENAEKKDLGNDIETSLEKNFFIERFLTNYFRLSKKELLEEQYPVLLPKSIPPSSFTKKKLEELIQITGKENVSSDPFSRISHASGKFFIDVLRCRQGKFSNLPDAVVYPRNEKEIYQVIQWCSKKKAAAVPCGRRSSVTRSLEMPHGGISIDLTRHCKRILSFNKINSSITVEPGISGPELEAYLNKRGFTCGHFPQSFEYSTVGGWAAARGAGHASTAYGTIADIVLSLCLVTTKGFLETKDYPAASIGPEIQRILLGSEGNLGILTRITLKIRPFNSRHCTAGCFVFKDFKNALEAMREVMQGQFGFPHFFRLQDSDETSFAFQMAGKKGGLLDRFLHWRGYLSQKRCFLHMAAYGDKDLQALIRSKVKAAARRNGAFFIGSQPVRRWLKQRYSSAYLRDVLLDRGICIDTLETSANWQNIPQLRQTVRKKIKQRPKTLCLCHISHAYENGANLYFIFITKLKKGKEEEDFMNFHRGIVDTIQKNGGALSHHHGLGRLLSPWLKKEIGPIGWDILASIKKCMDPKNIFNPGGMWGA